VTRLPLAGIVDRVSTSALCWAAGFIEGEGSVYFDKRVVTLRVPQTQREPLDRLVGILGGSIYFRARAKPHHKDQHVFRLNGRYAVGAVMTLYVLMSPGRQEQIRRALAAWRVAPSKKRPACQRGHLYVVGSFYVYPVKTRRGIGEHRMCKQCAADRRAA
jgi:hypothetical protein